MEPISDESHLFSLEIQEPQLGRASRCLGWLLPASDPFGDFVFFVLFSFLSGRLKRDCPTFQENEGSNTLRN